MDLKARVNARRNVCAKFASADIEEGMRPGSFTRTPSAGPTCSKPGRPDWHLQPVYNEAAPDTPMFVLHLYNRAWRNRAALRAVATQRRRPIRQAPSSSAIETATRRHCWSLSQIR